MNREREVVELGPELANLRVFRLDRGWFLEMNWTEITVDGEYARFRQERAAVATDAEVFQLIERWQSKFVMGQEPGREPPPAPDPDPEVDEEPDSSDELLLTEEMAPDNNLTDAEVAEIKDKIRKLQGLVAEGE